MATVDYDSNLKSLKKFFEDLIIIEYKTKRNKQFIDLLVDLVFCNMLIQRIENETVDVDNSIGAQLDVVGRWVGVNRLYSNVDLWTSKYFSFPSYSQIKKNNYTQYQGGFSTYVNFSTLQGAWLMWLIYIDIHTQAHQLGDNYFRFLIRLKIISNSINHTQKNIDEAMYSLTNGEVYTTWGKMSLTYNVNSRYLQIMNIAMDKGVLPQPTGCSIEIKQYDLVKTQTV